MMLENNKLNLLVEEIQRQRSGHSETREAFIIVLSTATKPMKTEEICESLQKLRPETEQATVMYRFIYKLTTAGLLRRMHGRTKVSSISCE